MTTFELYAGLVSELRVARVSKNTKREEAIEDELERLWEELTPEEKLSTELFAVLAFP